MKISTTQIYNILSDCLFRSDEMVDNKPINTELVVVGHGIAGPDHGLHRERLESHREDIRNFLRQLPVSFVQEPEGDSFLNACNTRDGDQWGEHADMERLFVLGTALGLVKYSPQEEWNKLPGGVPHIRIIL